MAMICRVVRIIHEYAGRLAKKQALGRTPIYTGNTFGYNRRVTRVSL